MLFATKEHNIQRGGQRLKAAVSDTGLPPSPPPLPRVRSPQHRGHWLWLRGERVWGRGEVDCRREVGRARSTETAWNHACCTCLLINPQTSLS